MNREQLEAEVKRQLPEKRWIHTLGVVETAVKLAGQYGADAEKADLAALLHDIAKYWPVKKMEAVIRGHRLPEELLDYDKELWHAPVGAFVAQTELGVADQAVLDAIRYHTSGRAGMTLLDKVVCLADYIEPGRNFPGVAEIRKLAESNLEQAMLAGFDSTIRFLLDHHKRIFPLTLEARNALIAELEHKKQ